MMSDERYLILQMLEKGKITVDEAIALLDALEKGESPEKASTQGQQDAVSETESETSPTAAQDLSVKPGVDESPKGRIESGFEQLRETLRQKSPGPEEINNLMRTVKKGIAQVIDELPDVMHRLLNWEFGSGTGQIHEESFEGSFAAQGPVTIRIHNEDGPIKVTRSDGDQYAVRVINTVRLEDEGEARAISKSIVDCQSTPDGLRLIVSDHPRVASKVYVSLPAGFLYIADVSSEDGSIVWHAVDAESISLHSGDGAITVQQAKVEKIAAHTHDGAVWLQGIKTDWVEAASSDGSLRFEGFAKNLRLKTADGAVRATLEPLPDTEPPAAQELAWELISADGSVSVQVPAGETYGYDLNLATSDGRVSVDLPHLQTETKSYPNAFTGRTQSFETKSVRAQLNIRTADGSIRVTALE